MKSVESLQSGRRSACSSKSRTCTQCWVPQHPLGLILTRTSSGICRVRSAAKRPLCNLEVRQRGHCAIWTCASCSKSRLPGNSRGLPQTFSDDCSSPSGYGLALRRERHDDGELGLGGLVRREVRAERAEHASAAQRTPPRTPPRASRATRRLSCVCSGQDARRVGLLLDHDACDASTRCGQDQPAARAQRQGQGTRSGRHAGAQIPRALAAPNAAQQLRGRCSPPVGAAAPVERSARSPSVPHAQKCPSTPALSLSTRSRVPFSLP